MPIIILIVILVAIIGVPYALIFALNTLFGLGIVWGFWPWLAALIIVMLFAPNSTIRIKKD